MIISDPAVTIAIQNVLMAHVPIWKNVAQTVGLILAAGVGAAALYGKRAGQEGGGAGAVIWFCVSSVLLIIGGGLPNP